MRKLLACLTISLPLCANASDWANIADNGKVFYMIDLTSVAKSGQYKRAWFKAAYFEPQTIPNSYPAKTYRNEVGLYYFDCKSRKYAQTQGILNESISGDGDVVSTWNTPFISTYMIDIPPDSIAERMLRAVCATAGEPVK
jgi:hypothetical protein